MDVQNTFCVPGFELFVAGASGQAAVDDNRRLCDFVYRNLGSITQTVPSLDTHHAMQIFHAAWLVDADGNRPEPMTLVTARGRGRGPLARGPRRGARRPASTPTTPSATWSTTRASWPTAASTT